MTRPSPPTQSGCSPPAGRRQHPICSPQPFQGPRPAPPSPAIPCSPRLGMLCSGTGRQGYPGLPGRQRLWKPPGSCFQPCGPRASEREGPGREPVPCRPALLVQLACPPHPHRGLLSGQMRHFINCVLNTCFKLVKKKKKSLLQHHNSKASILQCSAFFVIQFSHLYMTTRKTIALTIWTFVGKMLSLLYNMLSMFVMKNNHAKHLSQRGIKDTI